MVCQGGTERDNHLPSFILHTLLMWSERGQHHDPRAQRASLVPESMS